MNNMRENIESYSSNPPKPLTGEEQYFLVSFLKRLVESIEEKEKDNLKR